MTPASAYPAGRQKLTMIHITPGTAARKST
jgi:hypothetical protein